MIAKCPSSVQKLAMSVRGFEPPHNNVLNVAPLPLGYTDEL